MSLPATNQLLRSAPYFPVVDLDGSVAYYERVFGFRCDYIGGTPPEFAIMSRDGLSIMLRLVTESERILPNEKQGGTWDVFFWVRDVETLHAELTASGADVVYGPIVQQAYRMKEFAVRDRDGYVLGFGQPLTVARPVQNDSADVGTVRTDGGVRLNYAIVFVRDMHQGVEFYRDIVGLPLRFESPSWTEFATEGATVALHISEEGLAGRCRPGLAVSNLDAFHEKMVQRGVCCLQAPKEIAGARVAQYADPDGLAFSAGEQR